FAVSRSQEGGFVDEIRQIGPDEAGGEAGNIFQIHRTVELHILDVNFENRLTTDNIGAIDEHMTIEAAGAEQGGLACCGRSRGRQHKYATIGTEAVQFDEEGLERLLALVMTADDA